MQKNLQNFTQYMTLYLPNQKVCKKTPEFHETYDPKVTKSKGMLKTPDFHASYDSIVTKSKGMQKISRISRNI